MSQQDAGQWFIARDGKRTGPISTVEIGAIAAHGYFRATDLVWRPGFPEWRPAFTVFPPPQPSAPPPVPAAATAPRPIAQVQPPRTEPQPLPMSTPQDVTGRPTGQPSSRVQYTPAPQPDVTTSLSAPPPWSPTPAASETTRLPTAPPYRVDPQLRQPDRRETTRPATRSVQPVESAHEPEPSRPRQKTPRTAWAALAIVVVAVAGGVWVAASPNAILVLKSGLQQAATMGGRGSSDTATAELDARWQRIAFWPVIKREFPDWYGERLRETTAFTRENRPPAEITKSIADQLIALRRQNATLALAASTPRLKALAAAFLDNLKQLKARSTQACFSFISQGEGTPGVAELLQVAESQPTGLQLQVAAIFEAIAEGRKSPVEHAKPQKADYDALMDQLAKLGWSQADVATFADPRALARAEPAKVCQMVQDWFVAHIALPDEGSQERLLGETLRPVVSG